MDKTLELALAVITENYTSYQGKLTHLEVCTVYSILSVLLNVAVKHSLSKTVNTLLESIDLEKLVEELNQREQTLIYVDVQSLYHQVTATPDVRLRALLNLWFNKYLGTVS